MIHYAIDRRDSRGERVFGVQHLVVKVHDAGERYLIATYRDEAQAQECLAALAKSLEGRKAHGAKSL